MNIRDTYVLMQSLSGLDDSDFDRACAMHHRLCMAYDEEEQRDRMEKFYEETGYKDWKGGSEDDERYLRMIEEMQERMGLPDGRIEVVDGAFDKLKKLQNMLMEENLFQNVKSRGKE